MSRSANREAAAFLEQALTCLDHVPEGREAVERAIDTRFDLRTALQPLGDQARIHDHLRKAVSLAESLGDVHRQTRASNLMTQYYWWTGRPDRAVASGERTCALVESLKDIGLKVVADAYLGAAYHALGDYKRAMELLQQTVDSLSSDLIYQRFGQVMIPSVFSRVFLAWCHAERGEFADGIAHGDSAIQIAETAEHSYSLTLAHLAVGMLHLRKGDLTRAISVLEQGLSLCETADVPVRIPWFAAALGHALSLSGRTAEGLPLMKQAVERASAMNVTVDQSLRYGWLSEAYMDAGQGNEALRLAERALELARQHRERGNEAWILQLLGVLCLSGDAPDLGKAETFSREALALAADLEMEPLVAHSHLSLAMLHWKCGRRREASCEKATAVAKFQALDMPFWLDRERSIIAAKPSGSGS
jgi:tetratricopeptide (TPR) repeat protein